MKLCLACRSPLNGESTYSGAVLTAEKSSESILRQDWCCASCGFRPQEQAGVLCFSPELAREGAGFDAGMFPKLAAMEAKHFWYRTRNQLILWAFQQYFPQAPSFFEIGCGTGFVISNLQRAMPHVQCAGSEAFIQGLDFARKRLETDSLWQMDARNIPFRDEFDVIGAFDVLEHIEEDEAVLAQMYQAVKKPGGGILLTVPQHMALWSYSDVRAHHVRRYEMGELKRKVERAGFQVVMMTSFVSLLSPLMWISRKLDRDTSQDIDESYEFQINPILNRLFEAVMLPEIKLIQSGMRFPFGGSLMMVAKA